MTFWVYLETRSVMATGLIAGIFLVATASTGITWFGSLVDHHRKQAVIQASAVASLVCYVVGLGLYLVVPESEWRDAASPLLWVFVVVLMLGVIAGNLRGHRPAHARHPAGAGGCEMPEQLRDRANGLVGTTTGVSFLVTSVISGLLVASTAWRSALVILPSLLTVASLVHLGTDRGTRARVVAPGGRGGLRQGRPARHAPRRARRTRTAGPDHLLVAFNNFLGGAFMALMDAYGLSLVSVQAWGPAVGRAQRRLHRRRAARRAYRRRAPTRCGCSCW